MDNATLRALAIRIAAGEPPTAAARALGLSPQRVATLLTDPSLTQLIERFRDEHQVQLRQLRVHLKQLENAEAGVELIGSVIRDPDVDAPTRLRAAQYALDRAVGRAPWAEPPDSTSAPTETRTIDPTALQDLASALASLKGVLTSYPAEATPLDPAPSRSLDCDD